MSGGEDDDCACGRTRLLDDERLGASFLLSRGGGDGANARELLLPSINISSQFLADKWRKLLVGLLSQLEKEKGGCQLVPRTAGI